MSLRTDQFFYNALLASDEITAEVEGRIFNPARSTVDENEDRVPYIIITFDSLVNDQTTKDEVESDTDTVTIGILCVADDRESLADLTEAVRTQCRTYLESIDESDEGAELAPLDWALSASAVQYDDMKPCVYQRLNYQCDTNR